MRWVNNVPLLVMSSDYEFIIFIKSVNIVDIIEHQKISV